jgi:hypothetical protein
MNNLALILGICTGILSILTFLGGTYAYIKSSSTKKYAAEREIGHVKKSLETVASNLLFLTREIDRRVDSIEHSLLEIKTFIALNSNKNSRDN